MKEIYFIVNKHNGSAILRAEQIKERLTNYFKSPIYVINVSSVLQLKKQNCIFIWIGLIKPKIARSLLKNNNINILDIVDKYINNEKYFEKNINDNIYQIIIVNNNFMKTHFEKLTQFNGKIWTIYHHWDPRLSMTNTKTENSLRFGYMGSIKSLLHTNNFLYYNKLIELYPIIFFDTEIGENVTENVLNNNLQYKIKYTSNNIPDELLFNCHINIREDHSNLSKFKTTAKLATAVALGHNIITTKDESIKDILPIDYAFILENSNFDTVNNMFQLVIDDYNNTKTLWNKGLSILKNVKIELSLSTIRNEYIRMLDSCIS